VGWGGNPQRSPPLQCCIEPSYRCGLTVCKLPVWGATWWDYEGTGACVMYGWGYIVLLSCEGTTHGMVEGCVGVVVCVLCGCRCGCEWRGVLVRVIGLHACVRVC